MEMYKRPEWWNYPECWVDVEDIQDIIDSINIAFAKKSAEDRQAITDKQLRKAGEVLKDLNVDRDRVEFATFNELYVNSLSNIKPPTAKQKRALLLAEEAERLGETPSKYVASKMKITQRSANRLLNRAYLRATKVRIKYEFKTKIVHYDNSKAVFNRTKTKFELPMSKIDGILRRQWVACPTQVANRGDKRFNLKACTGKAPANMGMCHACWKYFNHPMLFPDGVPDWALKLKYSTRKEQRDRVREELFIQKYGINQDVSELI